jgi:hypothetical protein
MSGNVQKIPFVYSSSRASINRIKQAIDVLGQSLPATVAKVISSGIVQVNFEVMQSPFTLSQVIVPVHMSEYVRLPIQVGCKGYVNTADYYLGGMSGLGGGTADLTQRGNLTTLVFAPIGNTGWSTDQIDGNLLCQYGPNGVRLMDAGRNCIFTLTSTGITITVGGKTWTWTADGLSVDGYVQAANAVIAGYGGSDQVGLQTHTHNQPVDSHGDTEQPTDAPNAGT